MARVAHTRLTIGTAANLKVALTARVAHMGIPTGFIGNAENIAEIVATDLQMKRKKEKE